MEGVLVAVVSGCFALLVVLAQARTQRENKKDHSHVATELSSLRTAVCDTRVSVLETRAYISDVRDDVRDLTVKTDDLTNLTAEQNARLSALEGG